MGKTGVLLIILTSSLDGGGDDNYSDLPGNEGTHVCLLNIIGSLRSDANLLVPLAAAIAMEAWLLWRRWRRGRGDGGTTNAQDSDVVGLELGNANTKETVLGSSKPARKSVGNPIYTSKSYFNKDAKDTKRSKKKAKRDNGKAIKLDRTSLRESVT